MRITIVGTILMFLVFISCQTSRDEQIENRDTFYLYNGKDSLLPGESSVRMVPVISDSILVFSDADIPEKLKIIADSLSEYYFNSLEIQIMDIDSVDNQTKTVVINLAEPPGYSGPSASDKYDSWYDFFQGSAGGQNTSIILRESFLQPHYNGPWIDAIEFYYNGEPMPRMDHTSLDGTIYSKKENHLK